MGTIPLCPVLRPSGVREPGSQAAVLCGYQGWKTQAAELRHLRLPLTMPACSGGSKEGDGWASATGSMKARERKGAGGMAARGGCRSGTSWRGGLWASSPQSLSRGRLDPQFSFPL